MRDRTLKVISLLMAFILILSAPESALHLYAESFEEVEYGIEVPTEQKNENAEETYEELNYEEKEEQKEENQEQKENKNEEENENQENQNENKEEQQQEQDKQNEEQKEIQTENLIQENHTEALIDSTESMSYQTITVNAGYTDTIVDPVRKVYPAIFNRDSIFGETYDFIQVGISGSMPNDISVYASYIDLRQNLDNGTNGLQAVAGISIQLVDSNGYVYIPTDKLIVTIHGLPATFVYEYAEDVDREMQTGNYSGSVVVHRTLLEDVQSGYNPNVYFFDVQDLNLYDDTISFEAMKLDFIIAKQIETVQDTLVTDEEIEPSDEVTTSIGDDIPATDTFLIDEPDSFIQDIQIENQVEEEKKNTKNELYASIEEGDISVRFEGPESATLKTIEEEGNRKEAADALGIDEEYIESVKNVTLSIMDGDELVQPVSDVDIIFRMDDCVVVPITGNEEVVKEGDQYETTVSSMQTYAIVSVLKTDLMTADGTYEISTTFTGPDARLIVHELTGDEYNAYVQVTAETLGVTPDQIGYARAFDISIVDMDGNEHEPNGPVTIRLKEESELEGEANLVHFGEETDVLDMTTQETMDGYQYEFEPSSFSVFVLAYTVTYYKDCEGDTWKITVSYQKDADIPQDAELIVHEIETDDESIVKAFDMQLVYNGEIIQPDGKVDVSIELVDVNEDMHVESQEGDLYAYVMNGTLHYVTDHIAPIRITTIEKELVVDGLTYKVTATYDGDEKAELVVSEVMDDGYIADSLLRTGHETARVARAFDVKVVKADGEEYTGDVHIQIELEGLQECQDADVVHYGDEVEVMDSILVGDTVEFDTNSYSVYVIIGTDGTYVPQCTYTFWIWNDTLSKYTEYGFESNGTQVYHQTVTGQPIIPQLPSSGENEFAGWYEGYIDGDTVVISETSYDFSQPITTDSAVDLYAVYKKYGYVTFHGQDNVIATKRVLIGEECSITDVTATYTGEDSKRFYGWKYENSEEKITDDSIIVTANIDLYPIFKEGHWLSFYSGPAHSGSTYIAPVFCFDGVAELPRATRTGRTFDGWYTGTLTDDVVDYRVKFSDGMGRLVSDAEDDGIYVQRNLFLDADTTLYAKWSLAEYKIELWRENGNSYEFVRSDVMRGNPGTVVSVPARYENDSDELLEEFVFDHADDPKEITEDGSTVLNVYYNIEDYEISGEPHTIVFADSVEEEITLPEPITAVYGDELELPELTSPRTGYAFGGWFMDAACTIPAPDIMPDRDLTLYAGWTGVKNLVQIDPNYGALYAYNDSHELIGTGSTWFNSQVDEDPIQEYTHVKRDYVKSRSGTWYYVKHDRNYYKGSGSDRKTYYTQDMTEATEDKTFEYMPGVYSYAGWYEVHSDGTETPYEFGHPVDHPTSLRLHWKKAGDYYLFYNAGNGHVDQTLDGPYSDYAEVVLTRTATSNDATFVGWRAKNKLYLPGDTFVIHADDSTRSGGKDILTLTAVYDTVGSATIIYDVNSGSIADDANLGTCDDEPLEGRIEDGKAYIEGLEKNVKVRLSDGTGFTREGMEFLGWCDEPVCTGDATFYAGNELCGFTGETTLYAVWGVDVHYHVNNPDVNWEAATDGIYTQTVYYGTLAEEPNFQTNDFLGWALEDEFYDFSEPVTETLNLYGEWGNIRIDIHAVDPAFEIHDEWLDETHVAELTAEGIASHVQEHAVGFIAVCDEPSHIEEAKAITELYYNRPDHSLHVRFLTGADEPLGDNNIYVVCYEETDIPIEYRNVIGGTLTPSDMTEPSVYSDELNEILGDGYLYAIGPETDSLSELSVISQNLKVRQTWKGYQYSVGDEWFDIDELTFYVLVFDNQATVITVKEKTVGTEQAEFNYNFEINRISTVTESVLKQKHVNGEWIDEGNPDVSARSSTAFVVTEDFTLNENTRDIILEYSKTTSYEPGDTYEEDGELYRDMTTVTTTNSDQISVIQTVNQDYVTTIESESGIIDSYEWIYMTDGNDAEVTFVNTQAVRDVEVHLALIENGHVAIHDELRETENCTFEIGVDETLTFESLSPEDLYSNPDYAFGMVASGQNGEIEYMNVASVSYEPYEGYYELIAKNEEILGICHDVYYLYYPMPVIKYVKETKDGYQELETITYNSQSVYMNGQQVVQNQHIIIDMDDFIISQTGNHFRMPPILDDGIYERYLAYTRIGIGDGEHIDESELLVLELRVRNNTLEYHLADGEWHVMANATIYAIYTERGYDLEVDKNIAYDESNQELAGQSFIVVLRSMSINKDEYKAEGADSSIIHATKATNTEKGELSFTIRDGSRVRINGLARGTYEIKEQGSENYTTQMLSGPLNGTADDEIEGIVELNKETKVVITNTPDAICKVGDKLFFTISSAISHINKTETGSGIIEMLKDYTISNIDMAQVIHDMDVVITTSEEMDHKAVITFAHNGVVFQNDGICEFQNIILDGGSTSGHIVSTGSLTIGTGTIIRNIHCENGKAIEVKDLFINSGTVTDCSGKHVIYSTGNVTLSGTARITGCSAEEGGAIYADGGSIGLAGTSSISGNEATNGGSIYIKNAMLTLDQMSFIGGTATKGGSVYAKKGVITMKDGTITGSAESGGGIYLESGSITIEGGKINGNTAESGSAIYANGSVSMSGGEISGNRNGCAVMIASGTGTFSGGSITGNITNGAIQTGSTGSLNFSGTVRVVQNGQRAGQECNVILDRDSDTVINATGLEEGAEIGVYVSGDLEGTIFRNHGVPGAKFGTYTKEENLNVFKNDRLSGLQAKGESTTKKIIWGRSIQIEIRQLLDYTTFPPENSGDVKYTDDAYYPSYSQIAISQLAEQMYSSYSKQLTGTAVYGGAFSENATSYDDYLTDLKWDSTLNKWKGVGRNQREEVIEKLIIYYANPAYIDIENNTTMPLDITDLTVGRSVIDTTAAAGYGMVFAINDAIQTNLYPVTGSNLHLASGGSIRILIPGGCNKNYSFTAQFDTTTGLATKFRHGGTTEQLTAAQTLQPITRTGTLGTAGVTTEIIFGADKTICKITNNGHVEPFSKISEAVAYCVTNNLKTATIEMSTDYLIPKDDIVTIPEGYNLTFQTATAEPYKYPGTQASIGRDPDNKNSFISSTCSYTAFTQLLINNLKFDGKSIRGNSDGGAVKTKNVRVEIDNCEFKNFVSGNGGGIYIEFETTANYNYQNLSYLQVDHSTFANCRSDSTTSRQGGGGIWTNAYYFGMDTSTFTSCTAYDQGGAVFYRIDYTYLEDYRDNSSANVQNCIFTSCQAQAAGGLEIDAFHTTLTNDTFTNCQATKRNGGGMNLYTQSEDNSVNPADNYDSHITVTGCTFTNCTATQNGGGIRVLTNHTIIQDSTFTNCHTIQNGGGISITNLNAVEAEIYGCTITDCKTDKLGGGIYSKSHSLTVGDYNGKKTTITNCTSTQSGGGICQDRNGSADTPTLIVKADITNCKSNNMGGGIFTYAKTCTLTDTNISGCTAQNSGGGICQNKSFDSNMTLTNCTISGNTSGDKGGGIYSKLHSALVNSSITGNRLSTSNTENAAGIFIENSRKLILGAANIVDTSTISENYTATGAKSDARLWEGSGVNNKNSVLVRGELSGKIYVVNAKKIGSQFGTSEIAYCIGGDEDPTFIGDDGVIYGIVQRTDATGKILVWAGPPVCKITTENNELLYFKSGDPAIFDRLDSRSGTDGDRTSAFGFIRKPELYCENGTKYSGKVYCVQMLVTEYEAIDYISTNKQEKTIILKTASPDDAKYPLRGRGRCVISRGASFPVTSNLITMRNNFILQDIILDGGSEKGISAQASGGLLYAKDVYNETKMLITIKANTTLQNCITTKNGGAICMDKGSLSIEGGTISNCSGINGGGIFFQSGKTLTFKAGDIIGCTATENGGGVNLKNGTFNMEGGTISGCNAAKGGGVFVPHNTGSPFNMYGGYVIGNTATESGGGIAIEGSNSRIYFYKKPTVSGNYKGSELCNVELNQATKGVINTKSGGLYNGAYIGVYVNGEESDTGSNYFKHGLEGKPFGTYVQGDNTTTFYSFVNDRNGLKGGLITGAAARTIYWVKIFSVEVSKEVLDNKYAGNPDDEFEFLIRITGRATVTGQPNASDLLGEYGGVTFENDGSAATATVRLKAGESVTAENLSDGLTYSVTENLTEEQQAAYYKVKNSYSGLVGENNQKEGVDEKDWYISRLPFININPVCKIMDDREQLLYREYKGYVIPAIYTDLTDAVHALDGDLFTSTEVENKYEKTEFRIEMLVPEYILPEQVTIKSGKKVTIDTAEKEEDFPYRGEETAVIKRGFDDDSMFIVNGELTFDNIVVDGDNENFSASENGAVLYVNGKMVLTENAVIRNSHTTKSGTVYVEGEMEMSGTIAKNTSDEDGAGIYLKAGSTLKLSGSPNFGGKGINKWDDIEYKNGNIRIEEMPAKTNGAKEYTKARQDIYLTETDEEPTSIIVDGLEGEPGSIWVWAVSQNHYESTKPFAVIEHAGDYSVFRNAQTDDLTLCGENYLTGNTGENPEYVYWSGGLDVTFKKIDSFGRPQAGAVFSLYTNSTCTIAYEQKGQPVTATSTGLDAKATFEKLSSGVYYMKETGLPTGYVNSYDGNANVYVVLVGETALSDSIVSELTEEDIQKQTGTGEDKKRYAIFLLESGKAVKVPDIAQYGVMNISTNTQETILTKTDGEEPVEDMVFDLIRYDRTVVAMNCRSGKRGAFWIGSLPYGIYYLHEKNVGDEYVHLTGGDNWFVLTVNESGINSMRLSSALE